MNNLDLYNAVRAVPQEAQKLIQGGRLKGMTDINPMWRIKTLTEQFGKAGEGWYYDITDRWTEDGTNGEKCVFVNIDLFVKNGDEWSKPIQGTGGSKLIAKERAGLYTSDECYKMALTDAISVACKALGFGADIYWQSDRDKYNTIPADTKPQTRATQKEPSTAATPSPKANRIDTVKVQALSNKLAELQSLSDEYYRSCCNTIGKKCNNDYSKLTFAQWQEFYNMTERAIAKVQNGE